MNGETCMICGGKEAGQDGLYILGRHICLRCEREIMNADASDKQYEAYIVKLKGILGE